MTGTSGMSTGIKTEPKGSEGANYIVKVTGNCNLYCRYCYFRRRCPKVPTAPLNEDLAVSLIEQAVELSPKRVWFIWHGGEPLLRGLPFFERVVKCQQEQTRIKNTRFRNGIQTNGTLLSAEWLDLLEAGNFHIGISVDGPKEVHNKNRVYRSERGSFDEVMRAVELMQTRQIHFGALAVVTQDSLDRAEEIYRFFVNSGLKGFDFLPCVERNLETGNLTSYSVTTREFANFMIQVFDLWMQDDDPSIRIRYLINMMTGLLGGKPSSCKFNGSCGSYITIQPDGSVYPCDNFAGIEEFRLGSLVETPLREILANERRQKFLTWVSATKTSCASCNYLPFCQGGCSWHSYNSGAESSGRNYFCATRKRTFAYLTERLKPIVANLKEQDHLPIT